MYVMTGIIVPLLSCQNTVVCQLSLSSRQAGVVVQRSDYVTLYLKPHLKIFLNGPLDHICACAHLKIFLNGPCVLVSIKHLDRLLYKHRRAERDAICQILDKKCNLSTFLTRNAKNKKNYVECSSNFIKIP